MLSNQSGTFSGSPLAGAVGFPASAGFFVPGVIPSLYVRPEFLIGTPNTVMTTLGPFLPFFGTFTTITVEAGAWTAGTLVFPTGTTAMGSNGLGPGGVGSLSLVAPVRISRARLLPGLNGVTRLELVFAPEPDAILLLAAGAAFLIWASRGRS